MRHIRYQLRLSGLLTTLWVVALPVLSAPRYVRFPDRAVGSLQSWELNAAGTDFKINDLGKARGKLALPPGVECGLKLNYDGAQDLSFWNQLPPGALMAFISEDFDISDQQFLGLQHLEKLKVLEISSSDIGNKGFAHLKECQELRELVMPSSLINGKALDALKNLTTLRRIILDHNDLDDASMANLKGLKNLVAVRFQANKLSDAGIACLKGCDKLADVDIAQNKRVTDRSLPTILAWKKLFRLDIKDTSITMIGLRQLKQLPALIQLTFSFDSITPQQLAELRKILPHCQLIDGHSGKIPLDLFEPHVPKAH